MFTEKKLQNSDWQYFILRTALYPLQTTVSHNRFYLINKHISDYGHLGLRKHRKVKREKLS